MASGSADDQEAANAMSPEYPDFSDEDTPQAVDKEAKETPEPTPTDGSVSHKNCYQCGRRKRKCDRKLPGCGGCARAGTLCEYNKTYYKPNRDFVFNPPRYAQPSGHLPYPSETPNPSGGKRLRAPRPEEMVTPPAERSGSEGSHLVPSTAFLLNVDPANLYISQEFPNLKDFKQYVFDIARIQGWTPYLRRSDRRGAEVRCNSMANPHKPRTPEFNDAGCQFRVAARAWPDERRLKAGQLQHIEYNTVGRWGDGTEPARITMIQPVHICGRVAKTGASDSVSVEALRARATEEAKKRLRNQGWTKGKAKSRENAHRLRAGRAADDDQDGDGESSSEESHRLKRARQEFGSLIRPGRRRVTEPVMPLPMTDFPPKRKRGRPRKSEQLQRLAWEKAHASVQRSGVSTVPAIPTIPTVDDPLIDSEIQNAPEGFTPPAPADDEDIDPHMISFEALLNGDIEMPLDEFSGFDVDTTMADGSATGPNSYSHDLAEGATTQLPEEANTYSDLQTQDTTNTLEVSNARLIRKPRGPNLPTGRQRKPREGNAPIPDGMIRKHSSDLMRDVPSLFDHNPNWIEEITGPSLVEAAKTQWNCYIGIRQAYQILFRLREERGLVTSLQKRRELGLIDPDGNDILDDHYFSDDFQDDYDYSHEGSNDGYDQDEDVADVDDDTDPRRKRIWTGTANTVADPDLTEDEGLVEDSQDMEIYAEAQDSDMSFEQTDAEFVKQLQSKHITLQVRYLNATLRPSKFISTVQQNGRPKASSGSTARSVPHRPNPTTTTSNITNRRPSLSSHPSFLEQQNASLEFATREAEVSGECDPTWLRYIVDNVFGKVGREVLDGWMQIATGAVEPKGIAV